MLAAEVKTTNFLLLKLFLSIPQAGYTLGDASYLDIFHTLTEILLKSLNLKQTITSCPTLRARALKKNVSCFPGAANEGKLL